MDVAREGADDEMRRYTVKADGQLPYTPEQQVTGFLTAVVMGQLSEHTERTWAMQLKADFETGRLVKHLATLIS